MLTKKQLILTVLKNLTILTVAVSGALFVAVYSSKQINRISSAISEKKRVSYILEKRSETYTNLRRDFAILNGADGLIESALVPSDDISGFIGAVETLGVKSGVVQSYQFGIPNLSGALGNPEIASVDYSLRARTNIYGLIAYLKNFENMPYFSGIMSISISAGTPRGLDNDSDVSMSARLYARKNI